MYRLKKLFCLKFLVVIFTVTACGGAKVDSVIQTSTLERLTKFSKNKPTIGFLYIEAQRRHELDPRVASMITWMIGTNNINAAANIRIDQSLSSPVDRFFNVSIDAEKATNLSLVMNQISKLNLDRSHYSKKTNTTRELEYYCVWFDPRLHSEPFFLSLWNLFAGLEGQYFFQGDYKDVFLSDALSEELKRVQLFHHLELISKDAYQTYAPKNIDALRFYR